MLEEGTSLESSLHSPVYNFCLNKNPVKGTLAAVQFLMRKGERAQHFVTSVQEFFCMSQNL